MTRKEAYKKAAAGCKIRHSSFEPGAYLHYDKEGKLRDEKGFGYEESLWRFDLGGKWDEGWEIVEAPKTKFQRFIEATVQFLKGGAQ